MTPPLFGTIAIIGIGLIGSSIARAAAKNRLYGSCRLYDAEQAVRDQAQTLRLGEVTETLEAAVTGADCVVICTPVGVLGDVTEACAPFLQPGAILTDVGSVKAKASDAMAAHLPEGVHLVPGHPIAGTERSGPEAGFETLFEDRWCILTPRAGTPEAVTGQVAAFWEGMGSRVEVMDAARHDLVLAITSHLPHLIAFNIVATAEDLEQVTEGEVVKYSAGGFRDFTRIAASDPTMWRDVFLHNKEAVLETLGRFTEDLAALQRAIRWEDGDMLHQVFTRARGIRRSIVEAGQDTDAPNFGRDGSDPIKR